MIDYSVKSAHIVKSSKKLVDGLLEMNIQNRTIKKGHMQWLAEAIKNNDFHLTTQAIGVSDKGVLLDGQHRLMALKDAGYPSVDLLIVTGLSERSRIYIDQGAKRSTADMLKIVLNHSISHRMAALVTTHLKLAETKDGFVFRKDSGRKPSLDNVVEVMERHFDRISMLISAAGNLPRAGTLAAFFDYSLKYDHDSAIQLAEHVKNGENLTKNMPAYRLRAFILGGTKRTSYGSAGQLEDYKNTVTACLAHAREEELIALRPSNSWENIKMLPKNYPKNLVAGADGVIKKKKLAA